jgi:uncharacterized protein (DUF433 family)
VKGETSKSLTGAQVDEVAAKYRKGGVTIEQLAAEYKCSTAPIRNALKMRGVRVVRSRGKIAAMNFGQSMHGRIS